MAELSSLTFTACLIVLGTVQCKKIHEHMTADEVMGIFHTHREAVPDYEVVPVRHTMYGRSLQRSHEIQLTAFNQVVKLYLNPSEGILASQNTPLWTIRSDSRSRNGVKYTLIYNAMHSLAYTYHDIANNAAVIMEPLGLNAVLIDGIIGRDMVIRSLPKRLVKNAMYGINGLYEPHFQNSTQNDGLVYTYHHIVYKSPKLNGKQYHNFNITIPEDLAELIRKRRTVPDIIYPEILVVVDYHEYISLGNNIEQAKRYIISFWNGVDLRFRLLTMPRIRLNIAGIIIALDATAISYLEENRRDEASLDADRAIRGMGDYFYAESTFPRDMYDIAIAMTQLDMCNMVDDEFCDTSTLGYAYVAGACQRNEEKKTLKAVAIIEDNGGFSGIIAAAHEVGHLIGARHDGNPRTANNCPGDDGYIMTGGLLLHENGFEWSSCSINSFYKFLNEGRAICLYNQPIDGKQVPRILPGKMMSLDSQCEKIYATSKACNRDTSVCTRLECEVPGSGGFCSAITPAAEGSPCGNGLFCLNGKCVPEENETQDQGNKSIQFFISHFSHQMIQPNQG